ncbi:hypothetical protein [Micrococcus sp.]|uniref:hypothetical protein n=1 Tax=Micrococcus sp. TaxID=1271 RepID=UPI0026DCB164|nr:hypothetical protein [Micrococcus sp.]MDO4239783.1 hypothetical protein [Micrococcus sp.]
MTVTVTTTAELAEAVKDGAQEIVVSGRIADGPMITLPAGTTLRGADEDAELAFGGKGVRLTQDNTVKDLRITTAETEVAVLNDTRLPDAGTLRLENVTVEGSVYLEADAALTAMRVEVEGLHVRRADVRSRPHRPHGFGVDVLQGGFTLWNRQEDPSSVVTATVRGLAVGTAATPVRGSGVFVAGHGDEEGHGDGGRVEVDLLETGEVHTDGGIAPGTADVISGGVFVVSGVTVEKVVNAGPTTTHGQNDMVLDNWGDVKRWQVDAGVLSTGPSGIGFVNFGDIDELVVNAPITTVGKGARGFNLYDGSLRRGEFQDIRTFGDGSIGVQVSKPLPELVIHGDVATAGGKGVSLVRGVQTELEAMALSVKDGGEVDSLVVEGQLRTHGDELTTYQVTEQGRVKAVAVGGGVHAGGRDARECDIQGESPDPRRG